MLGPPGGFTEQNPPPSTSINSSSPMSHIDSFPYQLSLLRSNLTSLTMRVGSFWEGVVKVVEVVAPESYSVFTRVWWSRGISRLLETVGLLRRAADTATPNITVISLPELVTPVYATPSPYVVSCPLKSISTPPNPFLSCITRIDSSLVVESIQEGARSLPFLSQVQPAMSGLQGPSVTAVPGMGTLSVLLVTTPSVADFKATGIHPLLPLCTDICL